MRFSLQPVHSELMLCVQWNSIFLKQFVQGVLVLRFTEIYVGLVSRKSNLFRRRLRIVKQNRFPKIVVQKVLQDSKQMSVMEFIFGNAAKIKSSSLPKIDFLCSSSEFGKSSEQLFHGHLQPTT